MTRNKISKKLMWSSLIAGLILGISCTKEEPVPEEVLIEARLQQVINEKVGDDMEKLVGVSVSIRVGGEERWGLVGGLSEPGVPVTVDMKFGVGSITKTVVAATVMRLVDQGILRLDETVGDWLDLNNPHVNDSITIQQLLNHFSGLGGYMYLGLWDRAEANLNTPISPMDLSDYIGEPVNPRGVTHHYSNSNYLLLGLIIEAATRKTVGEVMREQFWNRLGLDHIFFGANESIPEPICTPWRDNDGDGSLENIKSGYGPAFHSIFYCAADVFATASDLSMWAWHLYGGEAVSEGSRGKMMNTYFTIPDPTFRGYGLGTRKNEYVGHDMWGHTGGMRGYGSHMFYNPEKQVSIAILNNQSRSAEGPLLRHELMVDLLAIVYASL